MAESTLIGLDVGTTATKAVLIDTRGRRLDGFARPHATARPQAGHAEQDPDEWMAGLLAALGHFAARHDLSGLVGIGLTSQVNTHVFVDEAGRPLLPAITWQDGRCAADAAALEARASAAERTAWFGAPMPIDASHALARMAHVARTRPDLYERTRHVLLPKDYCILHLTGALSTDPVSSVGLVNPEGYVADLLALVPGAAERLAPLNDLAAVVGTVRPGLPCAGVPVVAGVMDAWAGMFGVGVAGEGEAMYQSGTSEVAGIVSANTVPTPGVIVFPPYRGIVLHAAPTQAGGAALAWLGRILDKTPQQVAELAGLSAPGPSVPLFLPHLEGERAPIWDSAARGVFARLEPRTGAPELARAVLEGVGLAVRWAFTALESSTALKPRTIHIGGGGARSDLWCQIRADILGVPLNRSTAPESAALGAAILAGLGSGTFPSLAAAIAELVRYDRLFEPEPALAGHYETRFAQYQALYRSLVPFHAL